MSADCSLARISRVSRLDRKILSRMIMRARNLPVARRDGNMFER